MTSSFDTHFAKSGLPQLHAYFGEAVTITPQDGSVRYANGIVELNEAVRGSSDLTTMLTGVVYFKSSDRIILIPDESTPLSLTAKGYTWYVTDVEKDEGGQFGMRIMTEIVDNANAIDVTGSQHKYS